MTKMAIIPTASDVIAALVLFEHEFRNLDPKAAFTLGTITNDMHALDPRGMGFSVTVHALGEIAWAKHRDSFFSAMMDAIEIVMTKKERKEHERVSKP